MSIFVVVEDGTVQVIDGLDDARQYEPIDVESGVFVFYDSDGTWLRPRFTQPNRYRFFGLVLEQGSFELERSVELDPAVDPFDVAVAEAVALEPNAHFSSLEELKRAVAARRTGGAGA